jgi:nitroimidazol reductase NimA-like FMN-containing flavoprotein (pyridoxamine 5'-phosphate oxidase superfamily)
MDDREKVHMRRRDRAVDDEDWIATLLNEAEHGVVGSSLNDQPFLTNLLFYYDRKRRSIFLHTANKGRLKSNLEINPKVCFTVSRLGRYLPAGEALEFSVEYDSVVVFGESSIVEDPVCAEQALQNMLEKYFPHLKPGRDYRPIIAAELERTAVFEIRIDTWSAKSKRERCDYPGAFRKPSA